MLLASMAGTATLKSGKLGLGAKDGKMVTEADFTLNVNGRTQKVSADPNTPLLYILRDNLGEREARFGCGDGLCGACTVLIDGRAQHACDTPVSAVKGPIETAASLTGADKDHPILEALVARTAGQCGFCLAGIAMRAKAFLESTPTASRAEIAAALDGNLCRCGAHNRILDALMDAKADMGADQ